MIIKTKPPPLSLDLPVHHLAPPHNMERRNKIMDNRHTASHPLNPATANSCSPATVKRLLSRVTGSHLLSRGMGNRRLSKDMGSRRLNRVTGLLHLILPILSKIMDSSTRSRAMASNHLHSPGMAALHLPRHKEATTHNREDTGSRHLPHHAVTEASGHEQGVRMITRKGRLILIASLPRFESAGRQIEGVCCLDSGPLSIAVIEDCTRIKSPSQGKRLSDIRRAIRAAKQL